MKELIIYLMKVNVLFTILYLPFFLYLRRLTFFNVNRIYLLFIAVGALLAPIVSIPAFGESMPFEVALTPFIFDGVPVNEGHGQITIWLTVVFMLYLLGLMLSFSRFLYGFYRIVSFIRHAKKYKMSAYTRLEVLAAYPTFSFFNYLHFNEPDTSTDHCGVIEAHELVHIRQFHSADNLFYELFKSLCWFNPIVYKAHKDLRNVHEFLADGAVLCKKVSLKKYSTMLLARSSGTNEIKLAITFFQNTNLKSRIDMMNKNRSHKRQQIAYLTILPVLAIALMMNSAHGIAASGNLSEGTSASDSVYKIAEVPPVFPGDKEGMINYLVKNLKYPKDAEKENVEGTVYVEFVISETGTVNNVKVLRSIDSRLDKEAMRVISEMPKWTPGSVNGKNVKVSLVLPIKFQLT